MPLSSGTRSVHSSSLRFGDQHRKCHGWLLLFALPGAAAWPTCSCASTYKKTVNCKTVATSGLRNRLLKLADFVNDKGLILRAITLWLHCVFFSFGPWITASDSYRSRRWSTILLRSISPTSGSLVFILVFDVPSRTCFAQPGDHHSCQASDTGSALKKIKEIFKKNLVVTFRVRKKCPETKRSFQKKLQGIVETKNSRAWTFGAKSYKSAGNRKTLRNEHNSGKKRDIFELRMKIVPWEPCPKHSGVAETLPRPQLVIHPWRIYPSYGHWDDLFDDGYIRHMALNELRVQRLGHPLVPHGAQHTYHTVPHTLSLWLPMLSQHPLARICGPLWL